MKKGFLLDWDLLDQEKYFNEAQAGEKMLAKLEIDYSMQTFIREQAYDLVHRARNLKRGKGMMESFLEEFDISNKEGLALMCLAEALLRVPDKKTADALIAEKIASGDWRQHSGQSDSWLVNASTWGLMLTGRVLDVETLAQKDAGATLRKLVQRVGEPVIRRAMKQAMRIMGEQFVLGRTIKEAQKRARKQQGGSQALCSFDMLGEGARTEQDAERYFERYAASIHEVAKQRGDGGPEKVSGISVKLSALYPRYEARKEEEVFAVLYPRLKALAEIAAGQDLNLCVDAEEADRLVLSLKLFEKLAREKVLQGWQGLGLAVQAYQKRALSLLDSLVLLGQKTGHRFMVRLVKGAYWDTEIKYGHQLGVSDFSVWTTKTATDLNYLACAQKMLASPEVIYSQFATHNAHTLASIQKLVEQAGVPVEYQRLHGMGEALYEAAKEVYGTMNVRIYAPVGSHEDLLPYLVRRLLENGANTSFVNSFLDKDVPVELAAQDPFQQIPEEGLNGHAGIAKPPALYGVRRKNAIGIDLTQKEDQDRLLHAVRALEFPVQAGSLISGRLCCSGSPVSILNPADRTQKLGEGFEASESEIKEALLAARNAFPLWNAQEVEKRADCLRKIAEKLEEKKEEFIALMVCEAGKTYEDGIAEIREAIDFCRYYAVEAENNIGKARRLPGPAGETNFLSLHGRGVFLCISPWNFPLAIFVGQIAAALAAGNAVIAKPAEQTPLIAFKTVRLFHQAGIPEDVLHLVCGKGETVGAALTQSPEIDGVAFTGSTQAAQAINRALAAQSGAIKPLIAETGGLNGMFVDTTALREQVIDDVLSSAFGSAGQRCSALRVLLLPEETAESLLEGISGAMEELCFGNPGEMVTDIGPVIDEEAKTGLVNHVAEMKKTARILKQIPYKALAQKGSFFGPVLIEIDSLDQLNQEVFGPVLHVLRYKHSALERVMEALTNKKYGLTLGVHSRLKSFADQIQKGVVAGNVYINRNIIGAVVGVQPFGGERLSGTGPKAGGPHYLLRFTAERTVTTNIAAQGGDPELLNLA